MALLLVSDKTDVPTPGIGDLRVHIQLNSAADPLRLRRQVSLKMMLNAHSTAIMAKLGRVIGNTMTSVSPSNLKLIGRATYLIMTHVNDILGRPEWVALNGSVQPVSFEEANAVLFDAIEYVRVHFAGQTAEVGLSIIRIIEGLETRAPVSWEACQAILQNEGLALYLLRRNSALASERSR